MRYPSTPTLSDSSRSSVAGTSKIDFTPAHTTMIDVRDSVLRSADSSHESRARRCTPPSPPVAKTPMPARAARWAVEATVVAPSPPAAATAAISRTLALTTSGEVAIRSSAASSSPIRASPSTTRDRGRNRTRVAHRLLDAAGGAQVVRAGQAVADDRALERDDRPSVGQGVSHLGFDAHATILSPTMTSLTARRPRRCAAARHGRAVRSRRRTAFLRRRPGRAGRRAALGLPGRGGRATPKSTPRPTAARDPTRCSGSSPARPRRRGPIWLSPHPTARRSGSSGGRRANTAEPAGRLLATWEIYRRGYFGAIVADPDGNLVEAVVRE